MFKRKRKIEGFQKIAFFFRLARAQERERERERKRGPKSSSLSLSLSAAFPTVFAVLFSRRHPRGRDTTIPPPTRIGEASTIGKRLLCSYKREQRKDDDAFCAHASYHRGALVFSRTFRVDFLLTIVFNRVKSATISIRRAVPPVPFVRVNARVFARNKRRKSTLLLLLIMCSRFCLVFEESVFFFIRHKKGKKGKTSLV